MIPKIEKASLKEIQALQEQKLLEVLRYVNANSPFYQRLFKRENSAISTIKTIEDLRLLPVTTKEDLQKYNDDFICVPGNKIIDFATTSGTLGEPVTFGLTDADLERLAYNEAISFDCAGIKEGDIVQLMTTIDRRFMAGLAYFLGLRKMKVGVIRVGAGIPELQWDSILKYKPTYLIAVPSFLLKLIEYAEAHHIDYNNSSIKGAVCIGESLRNQDFSLNTLSQKITEKWNIKLFSTYASTEMSTAFTECEHSVGGHHHPELIIVEVLDDNNQPVRNGEAGELTFTTLGIEAMPLIRFKTGDIVQVSEGGYTGMLNVARKSMKLYFMRNERTDTIPSTPGDTARRRLQRPVQIIEVNLEKFNSLGIIVKPVSYTREQFAGIIGSLNTLLLDASVSKMDIVNWLTKNIPEFEHIETGLSLDKKM